MTLRATLYTTVAILSVSAGAAVAENHTATAEQPAEQTQGMGETGVFPLGWDADLDTRYADLAERPVAELIGINVLSPTGDDVGEIDNFVIMEDKLKAVIGVGGFLGLGEHEVALSLSDLDYDGTNIIVPFSAEELEAMPEYTEELEQIALNETDTFRTRGDMAAPADADANMAGTQLETDTPVDNAAEGMADAADNAGDAVAEGAAETEAMAENAAEETGDAMQEAGDEIAQAADATGDAVAEGADNAAATAGAAAGAVGSWFEQLQADFGDMTDARIGDFEGKEVMSAEGQVVGEVDDVGMLNGQPVAVVGIGGFLGMGEHDVALDLTQLGWNGEQFVIKGYSEADLKAMAEVDRSAVESFDADMTLRSTASM